MANGTLSSYFARESAKAAKKAGASATTPSASATTPSAMSSYFEQEKAKGTKAGGASPYSTPTEGQNVISGYFEQEKAKYTKAGGASPVSAFTGTAPANGQASAGGGPSAPIPTGATGGGGSGFVNFGQYFGTNAPAIQAQAQKTVEQAKAAPAAAVNAPAGSPGLGAARPSRFGPAPTTASIQQAQVDPFTGQVAQAQGQSSRLEQAARYGDMGKGTSAFDQMLAGGLVQRAAQQEQQRLAGLRGYLEGEQARQLSELEQDEAARRQQEEAQYAADRQQEEANWYARQEEERRYYEALRAQQEQAAAMDEELAGQDAYLDQIPDEY